MKWVNAVYMDYVLTLPRFEEVPTNLLVVLAVPRRDAF